MKILKNIPSFLEGKNTYAGLLVAFLGVLGLSDFISPAEVNEIFATVVTLFGLIYAVYGRWRSRARTAEEISDKNVADGGKATSAQDDDFFLEN